MPWPVTFAQIVAAQQRLASYLPMTALRQYPALDAAVGATVLVKHENHQPTCAFKVRNGLAALTALSDEERQRGVVCASTGNHGQGVAWAGQALGIDVTVCVPEKANPAKLEAMRGFGARLIEQGRDYDEAVAVMRQICHQENRIEIHGVNHPMMPVGAGTKTLEIVEQATALGLSIDAMFIAIGGGSQAVGAMTVLRKLSPRTQVIGVQAAGAATIHNAWHTGKREPGPPIATFAEGLATRNVYELTFDALREGLADFITVTDSEIAAAMRLMIAGTHNLTEPSGAAGLAGLLHLRERFRGKTVVIINCGSNVDPATLGRVTREAI